jgi:superfamily II DNA or RNA helicase
MRTVKVVTGAGKTLLALSTAELTYNAEDNYLHLAVVVPTIVLMHQWYDAIALSDSIRAGGPSSC